MFRNHPPHFALACLALCGVQLVLSLLLVRYFWVSSSPAMQWLAGTLIVTQTLLGLLVLMQLPRALQWRPRRNPRPSAELQAERQRIARELHDNVGSQLVSTMGLLDPQLPAHSQALRALEQCLLDLRLVVDSMDSAADSLTLRLARLRHRIQPVLDRRGIQMAWNVQTADGVETPCAERAQHMVSIVQEALSNVLQHAQATQVRVSVEHDAGQDAWCLEVCDNGRGLPEESSALRARPSGFGMEGMHRRARQMGGALELIRPVDGGTCIRVLVPDQGAPGQALPVL
ncbi:ATP-binding protein [Acidovorax sp. JG5]|jgi:signal transduction histidine kinase|nr:ATP-binding protein [Acidovorax sp. JG5]